MSYGMCGQLYYINKHHVRLTVPAESVELLSFDTKVVV